MYDVPATINYILLKTQQSKLSLLGHSMGGTEILVLLSSRPEFNKKINIAITWAPAALISHDIPGFFPNFLFRHSKRIKNLFSEYNLYQVMPRINKQRSDFLNVGFSLCWRLNIKSICLKLIDITLGFKNLNDLDLALILRIKDHYPQGTSLKTILHYGQIIKNRRFQQYDYGKMINLIKYNDLIPPEYPLNKITTPLIIYYARNDKLVTKNPDLITKYGYPVEAHKVVTDDGYILEMHRIPFGRYEDKRSARFPRNSILLQHGLAGSSADWVLTGPEKALAYMLADEGYDVWLGNNRGNLYSRHHRELLSTNRTFWDFSFHELGIYDLPAMIDYILEVTSRYKLLYIGHSQGTTQFWVMTSTRPEYNDKVSLAVGLAPAAYTSHMRGPVTQLAKLTYFGVELLGSNLFILGKDLSILVIEIISRHFRAFDYGENNDKNFKLYNSLIPPDYQLDKISTPIALYSSDNDWLATPQDVDLLRAKLRNIVVDYKIKGRVFNHYDFLWGNSASESLYEPIIKLLRKYR
ncbi:hypothetical protein G9C98_000714 [Cotesia typhae]|uniref:Partial AB-hydrolase lipase domain-containing protein n=1 Tax=Cotesia typhae TaxID=2053667 RepID=A0A8J5VBZ9_9HYME|nr:hypothetical protein G9C98_000714 [Cotesia typhae]